MKAGEEMPRQHPLTPHGGKQGLATGTHQTNERPVVQTQRLHIGQMHFQHVRIDQAQNVRPPGLSPAVVMLEDAARGQNEGVLLAR